jgi:hypothetical protein
MNTPGYQEALRRIETWSAQQPDMVLSVSNLNLTVLPPIPSTVKNLDCAGNRLTALPELPQSLKILTCSRNQLTNLPELPGSLYMLFCDNNRLVSIPRLPDTLNTLSCSSNRLTELPNLPDSLRGLNCTINQLTTLPELPASLRLVFVGHNPYIAPFSDFVGTYLATGNVAQLIKSIHGYYAKIKGRNVSAVKQTMARKANLPANIASYIGSFLSGKPGTLNMQTTALHRNAGVGGSRRRRKSRKIIKRKSRRRH